VSLPPKPAITTPAHIRLGGDVGGVARPGRTVRFHSTAAIHRCRHRRLDLLLSRAVGGDADGDFEAFS
jgi:hypothetical protein